MPYSTIIAPVAGLVLLGVIFMLVMGIAAMVLGSRPARFYVIAWSSFLCGSVIFLLKTFGVLPHTFFTQNGWQIGSLLEMILLSMTLSTRMNELQHQSRTDPLTLLGNRRLFDDQAAAGSSPSLARSRSRCRCWCSISITSRVTTIVMVMRAATRRSEAVANALRKFARKPLVACRYGGEEFTVILPGIDCQTAAVMSERLRRTVEETLNGDLAITISVGYACLARGDFENAEKFFEAADSALYRAKQSGRNCVVAFPRSRRTGAAAGARQRNGPLLPEPVDRDHQKQNDQQPQDDGRRQARFATHRAPVINGDRLITLAACPGQRCVGRDEMTWLGIEQHAVGHGG